MKREPKNLMEQAAVEVGLMDAGRALAWIVLWGWTADKLGRSPQVEEVAAVWKRGVSTAYKDQARFRRAFPGHETPERIWAAAREEVTARRVAVNATRAAAQLAGAPAVP